MKFADSMRSKLPFTTYNKKVDFAVRNILSINNIKFIPIIIVLRNNIDSIMESRLKRLGLKLKYSLPFINGFCGKFPVKNFESLLSIVEIEKIYLDGKAFLMESHQGDKKAEAIGHPLVRASYLSGKDVTVAYIDSGVYPHPDLTKPKNRILAFKDFINGIDYPYDDCGHGTACIGAGFGASVDGRFRALAYDAGIVCAKAFDHFSTGFYSDILAAMQWICDIREKYNVRIAVMPFGTTGFSKDFDILSRGAARLWDQGIFVCTCTGNLGPGEGTITSPGVCAYSFTSGACSVLEPEPRSVPWSGCGPIFSKLGKPDVIMPGLNIVALNADTEYLPDNKKSTSASSLNTMYRQISGTSAAASLTAAAAALLFQKNAALKPDDARSILRACAVTINELKTVQGAGIISIKKLEECL